MKEILLKIVPIIFISFAIYLIIAAVLIIINGKPKENISKQRALAFDELVIDYTELPPLNSYSCRDGMELNYRYYPAQTNKVLVLLHGSGWHSKYFLPLAKYISSENLAQVYTPDLRGHGISPIKRGDIDYINQLEDDLADFVSILKKEHPNSTLIIGGHSSGGGLAIRFAGSEYNKYVDAYLLLSPFLKYNAPTVKLNSGGWASAHIPRISGLSMLNNVGISWFNYLKVIDFNMPEAYRDGTETLSYSYRLNTGFAPRNYKKDLRAMTQKCLVVVGKSDESFIAEAYEPEMSKYKKDVNVKLLDSVTHMGVVMGEEVRPIIKKWITELK
ncbi:MAG: alpha/beta hydrolase [Dehalococcoidia bacterium]|nr:alpha/beta hydrolase [Dehalococcoidia bacterium]